LADSGTEQVEFIALSQRTGIPKYKEKVCCFGQFQNPNDSIVIRIFELLTIRHAHWSNFSDAKRSLTLWFGIST
jgi:hypothetical protein